VQAQTQANDRSFMDRLVKPAVLVDTLDNGLRVYFTRVNDVPLAEISIVVDAGVGREDEGTIGTAHLTNQMLIRGSKDRSKEMIERRLDQLGSILLPYTHYDYAQLYGKTLARNFRSTLEIMADAIVNPVFPEIELSGYKKEMSQLSMRSASSPGSRTSSHAIAAVLGENHPLTRSLQPEARTIEAADQLALQDFHRRWYRPERSSIIITGSLDYSFVRTLLQESFGRWKRGDVEPYPVLEGMSDQNEIIVIPDEESSKGLAFFRLAVPTMQRNDDDVYALILLNSILGSIDASRLRTGLWTDHVISPNFASTLGFGRGCGYLMISGSVSPALVDSVLIIIESVTNALMNEDVSASELDEAKKQFLADSPLTFASNRSLQSLLKEACIYDIPLDRALDIAGSIRNVTVDDVRRVARRILKSSQLRFVLLGDQKKIVPEIQRIGFDVKVLEN